MNGNLGIGSMITYNGQATALGITASNYSGVKTYQDSLHVTIALGDGTSISNTYSNMAKSMATVKVTEDNGTDVKGEFSGKIFSQEDSTKSLDVTEGSFHVKWIQ
jgi:hypothetical protein